MTRALVLLFLGIGLGCDIGALVTYLIMMRKYGP
jgi:hypothetical protein